MVVFAVSQTLAPLDEISRRGRVNDAGPTRSPATRFLLQTDPAVCFR